MALFGFGKKNDDPLHAGLDAYDREKYTEARRLFLRAAKADDAEAAFMLAMLYKFGLGVEEDKVQAFQWSLKAAELGHSGKMFEVAVSYIHGINGAEKDSEKALFWAEKAIQAKGKTTREADEPDEPIDNIIEEAVFYAADAAYKSGEYTKAIQYYKYGAEWGSIDAAYELALIYQNGEGVEKDKKQAFRHLLKVAELGDPDEMFYAAISYFYGLNGAEEDPEKALFWAKKVGKAQEEGRLDAHKPIDILIKKGQKLLDGDPFEIGLAAFRRRKYAEALRQFTSAAEAGSAAAAHNLSVMYRDGEGVEKGERQLFRWRLKAAELGYPSDQYNVAASYYYGKDGAEKNPEKALFWAKKAKQAQEEGKLDRNKPVSSLLRDIAFDAGLAANERGDCAEALAQYVLAAELGSSAAAHNLAMLYQDEIGAEKDVKQAFHWKLKAAELGNPDEMFDVAVSYYHGKDGAEKDTEKALFWMRKAKQAQTEGSLDKTRPVDGLLRDIEREVAFDAGNAAYRNGDCVEAIRQFERAAELGSSAAAHNLAVIYKSKEGIDKEEKQIFRWRRKAAELGYPDDLYNIAVSYYHGKDGAEEDPEKALFWAKKAKQAQEKGALSKDFPIDALLRSIEQSIVFDAGLAANESGDYAEALRQFTRAAELGSSSAAHNLAVMYRTGDGVSKDEKEAFRWSLEAAGMGHPDEMFTVAVSYFLGRNGAERDYTQALFWAKKAKQAQEEEKLDKDKPVDSLIRDIEQDIAFDAGAAAYRSGNHAEALQQYARAAELGSSTAAYNLAVMYRTGCGAEKDEKEAFRWNVKAAELGDSDAVYYAAVSYYFGQNGAEKNLTQALFWVEKAKQAQEEGELDKDKPVDSLLRDISFDAGLAAYKSGDYAEALAQFTRATELGFPAAAHILSVMYQGGIGVEKDEKESFRWSLKAAGMGHPDEMYDVAVCYFFGRHGAEKDYTQALFWAKKAKHAQEEEKLDRDKPVDSLIRDIEQNIAFDAGVAAQINGNYAEALAQYARAAELGSSFAALYLSVMYRDGKDVEKDEKQAFRWELKAAELGDSDAVYYTAISYFFGQNGAEKDLTQALFWAEKAKQAQEEGRLDKGKPVDNLLRDIAFDAGLAAYKSGDYAEALAQFVRLAELGSSAAALFLAKMYQNGEGAEKDEKQAFRWELKAAELGDPEAMFDVAARFYSGQDGAEQDINQALFWVNKAKHAQEEGKLDEDVSVDSLRRDIIRKRFFDEGAALYKKGDYKEARWKFEFAVDNGSSAAARNLAMMYRKGIGVREDREKAFLWELKAAGLGDPDAQYYVALSYFLGKNGTEQDLEKALDWAERAKWAQEEGELDKDKKVDDLLESICAAKKTGKTEIMQGKPVYRKQEDSILPVKAEHRHY